MEKYPGQKGEVNTAAQEAAERARAATEAYRRGDIHEADCIEQGGDPSAAEVPATVDYLIGQGADVTSYSEETKL